MQCDSGIITAEIVELLKTQIVNLKKIINDLESEKQILQSEKYKKQEIKTLLQVQGFNKALISKILNPAMKRVKSYDRKEIVDALGM